MSGEYAQCKVLLGTLLHVRDSTGFAMQAIETDQIISNVIRIYIILDKTKVFKLFKIGIKGVIAILYTEI